MGILKRFFHRLRGKPVPNKYHYHVTYRIVFDNGDVHHGNFITKRFRPLDCVEEFDLLNKSIVREIYATSPMVPKKENVIILNFQFLKRDY